MRTASLLLFLIAAPLLLMACTPTPDRGAETEEGSEFSPEVGATYQLDEERFEDGRLIICTSEKAVADYVEAERAGDREKMGGMIVVDKYDLDQIKKRECCIVISSYSRAKIIEKGKTAHRAEFEAWPFMPMWTYYTSFGELLMSGE